MLSALVLLQATTRPVSEIASSVGYESPSRFAVRFRDRFFDFYVNDPMGKVVTDKLRPEGKNDPFGVEQARSGMRTAYGIMDRQMAGRTEVLCHLRSNSILTLFL